MSMKKKINDQEAKEVYEWLMNKELDKHGFEKRSLGENMDVINGVIGQYWKPLFLLDNDARRAYVFMDECCKLQTVISDDILWDTISSRGLSRAHALSALYPTFIHNYKNGVAEVSWQLNPDGMYFMDEDGFGMTDDEELTIYGIIDRRGKVLVKFRELRNSSELVQMRHKAEKMVRDNE